MIGKLLAMLLTCGAALALLPGCGPQAGGPGATAVDTNRQVFQVKGLLKELKPNGKTAVIAHEEIPNYMEAMTMDFDAKDKAELQGLKAGDYLSFRMVVTSDDGWIENVRKVPAPAPADAGQSVAIPNTNSTNAVTYRRSPSVDPLSLGDKVPDYKFTNQFGAPLSLAQYQGRALGITFVFTRCPFPTCPRMSQHFQKAQTALRPASPPTAGFLHFLRSALRHPGAPAPLRHALQPRQQPLAVRHQRPLDHRRLHRAGRPDLLSGHSHRAPRPHSAHPRD